MFGCRRLDEDLKFPWFESVSHRWQITGEHVLPDFSVFVVVFCFFPVNALFLVR